MNLLFLGTHEDKVFLPRLKPLVSNAVVFVNLEPIMTWAQVATYCKSRDITGIISTSLTLLKKLTFLESGSPSIDNYAGSLFVRDGIEILFIDPLAHLITVPYGKFLTSHFITKFTKPGLWIDTLIYKPEFSFHLQDSNNSVAPLQNLYELFEEADLIAVDIETFKVNLAIRCVGYTAIKFLSPNSIHTESLVITCDSEYNLAWIRKFNTTAPPKTLQNGKYDISYLSRYDAQIINYLWDTATMMHCIHPELPKDLGFLQSFYVRNVQYWKDMAETHDLFEYYKYCAKDTWATALALLGMLYSLPEYAKTNYLQEFPTLFPAHLCEMTGLKLSEEKRLAQETKYNELIEQKQKSLEILVDTPGFNSNSPKQVKLLLKVLGCGDLESSDEKSLNKAAFRHPLNARILDEILDVRGWRKLVSTYLVKGKDLNGRILYSLNPHGTDTGRLASREHHFWCGLNIQNIPRGAEVKSCIVADSDFILYESDLEQAESRDTAHIAGDESLIAAVSGNKDFHSVNASAFFGRSYETIYDDISKKTLDKTLRDLAKRVNHGANYLMGPDVLVDTMGLINVYKAAATLGFPKFLTPKQIAEKLLEAFHKTYPFLSRVFYPGVVNEVVMTHQLKSKAKHDCKYQATTEGWVRECFKDPVKDKRAKNAYVAHCPQSLNAMTLNKAFIQVFYELAIHPTHSKNFKLHAQIHDSILFSVRKGHEYLADRVKELMEIPVTVKGYDGKVRTFTVPAALTKCGDTWAH